MNMQMMREITTELAGLYRRYSYMDMARHFEALSALIVEAEGHPIAQKEIAIDVLGDYRGMGSLNDQVIMANGKVDYEASGHLDRLLKDLRSLAIDVATRRSD